ncbi:hypothetical protein K466DRAFT_280615 [Polyporus arcularius HHB13444]|uniref:Uncharacterized protein n=1 Tax=Polyporus arcularius HHB13444 TaxID=1314778 RepID=A0A5C3NZT8_9APHY|nr:hypothetical protein K466DRAFT_280615 [Polyporus arcularius HHB13444]
MLIAQPALLVHPAPQHPHANAQLQTNSDQPNPSPTPPPQITRPPARRSRTNDHLPQPAPERGAPSLSSKRPSRFLLLRRFSGPSGG